MKHLERWPLLTSAGTFAALGVGVDLATGAPVAYAFMTLAAASVGAFLYAEGARRREWFDDPGPGGGIVRPDEIDRGDPRGPGLT